MSKKQPPKFDKEQLAAITAHQGAFRVDACAGAGKTSTLVGRYNFLRQQKGVPETDILAITFTKNAAEEMRERAGADKEQLRTMHSWALSVVKKEVMEFTPRLAPFPLLINQFEILLPIAKQHSVQYKDLTGYISNAKRQGLTPQEMLSEADNERQASMANAYAAYQMACKRAGVLDFDSIIWELAILMEQKSAVRARHQIPYLMVDEAQDCSEMDWRLIRLITERHGNVWVVGDFAQSIYGFRGASPHIFAGFGDMFPNAVTLPMGTNYRSQANIVTYSQQVMPEKTSYLENWKAFKPATVSNTFMKFDNDVQEAEWCLGKVQAGQCALNETAILARTNAQLAILQGFCTVKQIAYKLLGKENFWKRPEVLGLIGLAANIVGEDDAGLKRALQSPLPCVKFLRKAEAVEYLESQQSRAVDRPTGGPPPLKAFLQRAYTGNSRQDEVLHDVARIIETTRALRDGTPAAIMAKLLDLTGAKELTDEDVNANQENFVQDNLKKVVTIARSFQSMQNLLTFVKLTGKPSRKQNRLILSTVHGFKGQEAKNVFVVGVNLGVFPHDRADLQEEKRLYYVAVSRPTENLFVSCVGAPSPFIEAKVAEDVVPVPHDPWAGWGLEA